METFKNIFYYSISVIFTISCSNEQKKATLVTEKAKPIEWLASNYFLKGAYGNYYENWKKQDSVTYYGLGYFMDVENEDTLFRQKMKWIQDPDGIFMYFNVKNQNDNKDVEFRLTKHENNLFTFENPFRDYPSIITYKILSDTSVNVVMHGFEKGKEKNEDFIIEK